MVPGTFFFFLVTPVDACLVTMVIPSLDQEITADLVLAQMVLRVDASLPIAVIKILLLFSSRVFVIQDTLVSNMQIWKEKMFSGISCQ